MARTWRPGQPGYEQAEARWRAQYGHGQPKQVPASKARPGWPEPHPAVVARRVDEGLADLAAATPMAGTTGGQRGGCNHCVPCGLGAPERCHNPDSPAGRRHDADQARAADRDAGDAMRVAVELGLLHLPRA